MSIRPLSPADHAAAYQFLAKNPWENVMMMAVLWEWGLEASRVRDFFLFERRGEIRGVASFARDVALSGDDPEGLAAFGRLALPRRPALRRIISPKREVDAFWEIYGEIGLPIHFDRRQVLYRLSRERLVALTSPELREARPGDLDALLESGAAMNREELGIDPMATEPAAFRARVRGLIERRRIYCIIDEQGVAFQTAIHSQTPEAAQIAGVYTRPDRRGQGLATRALAEVCRRRLGSVASCCLFVNDFNAPARRAYEKIGFEEVGEFRAIFLDPAAPEP
jgi:uncharacterized protein